MKTKSVQFCGKTCSVKLKFDEQLLERGKTACIPHKMGYTSRGCMRTLTDNSRYGKVSGICGGDETGEKKYHRDGLWHFFVHIVRK